MKVSHPDRFCAAPGACCAVLFHGDSGLAAERRDAFARAHGGDRIEGALTFERIDGDALRRDPALLDTTMRARGFFADWRCVLVENAGDATVTEIAEAIDIADADTALVVVAGRLSAGSKLRKAFEGHRRAGAVACWPEPPSRSDIAAHLHARGVADIDRDAEAALADMAATIDRGAFWTELDKLALYRAGADGPLTAEDVRACGPTAFGAEVDAALDAIADRAPERLRRAMARLDAQGVGEETVLALALWRFRTLLSARAIMDVRGMGPEPALAKLSPPIRFPRSKPLARQLEGWRARALEAGFQTLLEAQTALRGSPAVAKRALVERALLRVALGGG